MNINSRTILETAIGGVIFAFFLAIGFLVFQKVFLQIDIGVQRDFLGAFVGAFFAFLFVRLGEGLTHIYNRKAKNRNTLVSLQHYLNDCLSLVGDNIYVANMYIDLYKSVNPNVDHQARVFANTFDPLPIERDLLLGLSNVDLINDLYSEFVDIRKLNDSMQTLNRMLAQTTEAFLAKNIDLRTFSANMLNYRNSVIELKRFLSAQKEGIATLFAASRVLLEDEPVLSKIIRLLSRRTFSKSQKERILIEIERFNKELEESAKSSKKRIEEIQKSNPSHGADN